MKVLAALQGVVVAGLLIDALYLRTVRLGQVARLGMSPEEGAPRRQWWRATISRELQTNGQLKRLWVASMYLLVGGLTVFLLGAIIDSSSGIVLTLSSIGVFSELLGVSLGIVAIHGLRANLLEG